MIKKTLLLSLLILILAGLGFSQEAKAKNAITLSPRFIGIEASYERMLSRQFSVLIDGTARAIKGYTVITASGKSRWYPFSKTFYLDLGLGYSYGNSKPTDYFGDIYIALDNITISFNGSVINDKELPKKYESFLIQPNLGWKIDIGKPNKFILPISLGANITVNKSGWAIIPHSVIGLGYAF